MGPGEKGGGWPVAAGGHYRGPAPQQKAGKNPDVGWRSPWDTDRALREKGKTKEVAGVTPVTQLTALTVPVQLSAI